MHPEICDISIYVFCSVDYMQQTGGQAHLFFWMTVEGYRVTAQQQLEVLLSRQKDGKHQTNQTKGLLRAAAVGIYEQYLSEKVSVYLGYCVFIFFGSIINNNFYSICKYPLLMLGTTTSQTLSRLILITFLLCIIIFIL